MHVADLDAAAGRNLDLAGVSAINVQRSGAKSE
jgi:hypothetical protein